MGIVTTLATPQRRIRTETTFEYEGPDRPADVAALRAALDAVCKEHPEIRAHSIVENDGELDISFELDINSTADPQTIVLEVIDSAVAAIGGRITDEHQDHAPPESSAVFEQLGTYLVPTR
jgi:hypothetical protein